MRKLVDLKINSEAIPELADLLIKELMTFSTTSAKVLALKGDLGAGKTTLVQAIGRQLGVTETITSPTFTIMKRYETGHPIIKTLVHMDAYRLEDTVELAPLRFTEIIREPESLLCVEWPERIATELPTKHLLVELTVLDEATRTVQVSRP